MLLVMDVGILVESKLVIEMFPSEFVADVLMVDVRLLVSMVTPAIEILPKAHVAQEVTFSIIPLRSSES